MLNLTPLLSFNYTTHSYWVNIFTVYFLFTFVMTLSSGDGLWCFNICDDLTCMCHYLNFVMALTLWWPYLCDDSTLERTLPLWWPFFYFDLTFVMDLVSFSIMLLTTPAWEAASSSDCNRSCTTSIVLSAAVSMLSRVCLGAYNLTTTVTTSVKSVYLKDFF